MLRQGRPKPPLRSAHRLQPGLPGYLILFAPPAFGPQRQGSPRESPSPPAFLLISTHFTATPGIPLSPTSLKSGSIRRNSSVKPRDFTYQLTRPPTPPLSPVIPNNASHLCITAAAGTELAVASLRFRQPRGVTLADFITRDRSLQPEGLHPPRGVAPSGFRPLRKILDCSLP